MGTRSGNSHIEENVVLKLMFVAHSHEMYGGAEAVLDEYVRTISREAEEVEVLVVVPAAGAVADQIARYGVSVQVVPHTPWADFGIMGPRDALLRTIRIMREISSARRVIRQWRPDVVLTNTMIIPTFAIAARTLRVPHVWMVHEFGKRDHNLSFVLGYRPTMWLIGQLSALVTCCSDAVRNELTECGISRLKLQTIYYGIELASDCESKAERKSCEQLRAIMVGRIASSKGQLLALRGIAMAKELDADVSIEFVGPEQDANYVAEMKSMDVDGVRFIGPVDDPAPYFCRADVALMCSQDEAFGRVTVEAMKLGLPVIGTDSGGTREIIVDGQNGYLVPPNDPSALAEKLKLLWADERLRSELGQQAQADALRRFSPTRSMTQLLNACASVRRSAT
jgi:glycosyltransferase involved in cell wall biosynthesis